MPINGMVELHNPVHKIRGWKMKLGKEHERLKSSLKKKGGGPFSTQPVRQSNQKGIFSYS